MSRAAELFYRRLLRARDAMDRHYDRPLEVPQLAAVAHLSPAHFSRSFRAAFGESPHRYLQRRRVERAMHLLRETQRSVTDIGWDVGFSSRGTFMRTFKDVVGTTPLAYRATTEPIGAPACLVMAATRPAGPAHPAVLETGAAPEPPSLNGVPHPATNQERC